MTRGTLILAFALGLCGCGGGGGGGTATSQTQSIAFATAGPAYRILDEGSYTNLASGGAGSGAITYQSDAPAVATVDAQSGTVTFVAAGVATISATKASDASYGSAHASYVLKIAPRNVSITAWTGTSDSNVTVQALPLAVNFIHSTDPNCDPTNVATCANGSSVPTASAAIVDATATVTQQAAYWLQHGSHLTEQVLAPEVDGDVLQPQQVAVLNGRMWVVEGSAMTVRSTADGVNWRLETANSGISPRADWVLLSANNALWLLGGYSTQNYTTYTDVWTSSDGKHWIRTTDAAWPARLRFAAAAFNGKLWIYGGTGGSSADEVWSSTDGVTWTQVTASATGSGREQHTLTAFNGRLWIIGGFGGWALADIWSSADGATWTQEAAQAEFGPRFAHAVVTDATHMWLIAGQNAYQTAQCDVWSSSDGRHWTQAAACAESGIRYRTNAIAWNGALWLVGQRGSDSWTSLEGSHWTKRALSTRIPGAYAVALGTYRSKLWLFSDAGWIWSSQDGFSWTRESAAPPSNGGHIHFVELPDRLLLFGLWEVPPPSTPPTTTQLWQSVDGTSWSQAAANPPYLPTGIEAVVSFNGQILVFADSALDPTIQEIWSTTDGSSWTSVASQAGFGPREAYQVFTYQNRLWVVGGVTANADLGDVWSSSDGVTWIRDSTPGLPVGQFHQALTLPDRICVYGSQYSSTPFANDAWCSSDGLSWQKVADDAPTGPLAYLSGSIWAIGTTIERPNRQDLVWKSTDGVSWRMGYQNVLTFQ